MNTLAHTGDSYIILNTMEPNKRVNLHFWIGKESTQDEYGQAAVLSANLDQALGDVPVQFREIEGQESEEFNEIFAAVGGVKYKAGGIESGFVHIEKPNLDDNQRILRLKGRANNIRSKEVKFEWASLTNDDVYIIEIGENLYRWKGQKANMFEWMESAKKANNIRDEEQNGRGEIFNLKQGDAWPEEVTNALGDAPREFPASKEADAPARRPGKVAQSTKPKIYRISNNSGKLVTSCVYEGVGYGKPERSLLDSNDCFIVDDAANGKMYIWKGTQSDREEKKGAMATADQFIDKKNYDRKTVSIQSFPENVESSAFRDLFAWRA